MSAVELRTGNENGRYRILSESDQSRTGPLDLRYFRCSKKPRSWLRKGQGNAKSGRRRRFSAVELFCPLPHTSSFTLRLASCWLVAFGFGFCRLCWIRVRFLCCFRLQFAPQRAVQIGLELRGSRSEARKARVTGASRSVQLISCFALPLSPRLLRHCDIAFKRVPHGLLHLVTIRSPSPF